jgi:hypothetical protein
MSQKQTKRLKKLADSVNLKKSSFRKIKDKFDKVPSIHREQFFTTLESLIKTPNE